MTKAASRHTGKDKAALEERLVQASELVSKMSDWKDFATEPKFVELCESMEKLIGSKKHADKLATDIAKLQDAWKALGHSDSADKHWDRFKIAADAAYQPCADFFAKRHETRRQNLKNREPLVHRMKALLDDTQWGAEPDYKNIENELQSIHNEWQKIKDVERGAGQKQWNRISKIRAAVYEKLDLVYDANIALKQQLVDQADALCALEVKEDSLDKLKFIQSKWKHIGVTRRKQDQATWKAFKKATDAVFEKIQGQRHAKRAAEDEQLEGNRSIINSIYSLSKGAKNLAEADHEFERLQNEYQQLPRFPKGLHEKLIERVESDYSRAESAFSKAREGLLKAQKQGAFEQLVNKAKLCTSLEALAHSADANDVQDIRDQIDAIEIANNDHSKRMQKRIDAALDKDRSAAHAKRRALCVDLEILLGVDSPAEDSSLRMQTQLERMKNKGLGQSVDVAKRLKEMKIDWLCLPGADSEAQAKMDLRFNALLSKNSK